MNHRRLAAAAVALLLPIGAACSGDDDDAVLQTDTADQPDRPTTTAGADDDVGTTATTDAGGSDTDAGTSNDDLPEDAALDVSVRTPGGVTLTVSQLSFDGDDILVDAEFINGQGDYEIYLWQGNGYSDRLRLVDDSGNEYNLIESSGAGSPMASGQLVLQPAESISGTFAFRGPLAGQPETLSLVTNTNTESIPSYRLEDQAEGYNPAFVVPLELTWA